MGRYLNHSDQGERIREVLRTDPLGPSRAIPGTPKRLIRHLSNAQMDELLQGYLDGIPVDDLAVRFGIDPSTVEKHVRRRDLPRRSPRLGPSHLEDATQAYRDGESLAMLAKHYGIGKDAVARALRRAGVELRVRNGWGP
jgi:hypothetical protein